MFTNEKATPKDPLTPASLQQPAAAVEEADGYFLIRFHEGDAATTKTVSSEEMNTLDRRAADEFNIPSQILMENAGRAIAAAAFSLLRTGERKNTIVVCGSGKNGGDGLVAARYLFNRGVPTAVYLVKPAESFKGDSLVHYRIARAMEVPIMPFEGGLPSGAGLVIDALLGTGLKGTVKSGHADAIAAINTEGAPILSVDIPSGIDADSGAVLGTAVKATVTVTMGLPKTGMLTETARPYVGELFVADIGLPRQLLNE